MKFCSVVKASVMRLHRVCSKGFLSFSDLYIIDILISNFRSNFPANLVPATLSSRKQQLSMLSALFSTNTAFIMRS